MPVPTRQGARLALACPATWPNKSRFVADLIVVEKAEGMRISSREYYRHDAPVTFLSLGFGIAWLLFVHFESDVLHGIIVRLRGREWRPPERSAALFAAIVCYGMLATFFVLEQALRRGTAAKTLDATPFDRGTTRAIGLAFLSCALSVMVAPLLTHLGLGE